MHYKLGRLTLPQGGNHARILINLCYGYAFAALNVTQSNSWNTTNYTLEINLHSSNGYKVLQSNGSYTYYVSSRCLDTGSVNDSMLYLTSPGIFYNGYVVASSPYTKPMDVYLAMTDDPLNKIFVWIKSWPANGRPLYQVTQSAGTFEASTDALAYVPSNGWSKLDIYQNTLTRIYKNPNNAMP